MTDENMKRHNFVKVKGNTYHVKDNTLDLRNLGIIDITEIEGLDKLTTLKVLILRGNQIEEIKGLEHLINLQELDLRWNQIEEIKGLETLTNLEKLELWGNPIREDEQHLFKKFESAQDIVGYCQEKARMTNDPDRKA